MKRLKVALALLVVFSTAMAGVPLVSAADTPSVHKEKVTGSPAYVAIDTSNITVSQFRVDVHVAPNKNGNRVLMYRETHHTAQVNENRLLINNHGAYKNVTVTLRGLNGSSPDVTVYGANNWDNVHGSTNLFSTGGDAGLSCGVLEGIGTTAYSSGPHTDCGYTLPPTKMWNSTKLDVEEVEMEIYQSGLASADSADIIQAVIDNRLTDLETRALIEGKNALIRSLNAGDSSSVARSNATGAVQDVYSVVERNLLAQWNKQVSMIQYLKKRAVNETGIVDRFVEVPYQDDDGSYDKAMLNMKIEGFGTTSFTLENGTSVTAQTIRVNVTGSETTIYSIGPTTGEIEEAKPQSATSESYSSDLIRVRVRSPKSGYPAETLLRFSTYKQKFAAIGSNTTQATNQMTTVADTVVPAYKAGEINNTELFDPYVAAAQHSPGDEYQTWAATQLANLGVSAPANMSRMGWMNVSINGTQAEKGLLLSQTNPPNGSFEINTTYDPANINGTQWLVGADGNTQEIKKPFTLTDIRTADGANKTNFTIDNVQYKTESVGNLSTLYQELNELQAQLEARQNTYGSGAAIFGSSSMKWLAIAGAGAMVLFYLEKNDKSDITEGNNRGRR